MRAHYETMIRDNDRKVKKALRIQNRDAQSAFCGGFPDEDGLYHARYALYLLKNMTAAYCNEQSVYFKDERVAERILSVLSFVKGTSMRTGFLT